MPLLYLRSGLMKLKSCFFSARFQLRIHPVGLSFLSFEFWLLSLLNGMYLLVLPYVLCAFFYWIRPTSIRRVSVLDFLEVYLRG